MVVFMTVGLFSLVSSGLLKQLGYSCRLLAKIRWFCQCEKASKLMTV